MLNDWIVEVVEVLTDDFAGLFTVVELLTVAELCVTSEVDAMEVLTVDVEED